MSRSFGKYGGVSRQGNDGPNDNASEGNSFAEGRGANGRAAAGHCSHDCDVTTGVKKLSFIVGVLEERYYYLLDASGENAVHVIRMLCVSL